MKSFTGKFTLIAILTALGILACYPPDKKLKTGIDLSGGTILVYEVKADPNNAGKVNLDDLIAALKRRLNPEGVLDIPIRKLGNNRIEIIYPKATAEDVEEVKRKITNVGSLEFRILANERDDKGVRDKAETDKNGLKRPPSGYLWAKLGERITGDAPESPADSTTLIDRDKRWVKNAYAGQTVAITGKTSAADANEATVPVQITGNTFNTLTLAKPHGLTSVTKYLIDYNPSSIQPIDPFTPVNNPIIREETIAPGQVERYILVKKDRYNATGRNLASVSQKEDSEFKPAVGFNFDRAGARKFGGLTGEFSPKEDGQFKYRLAILLDNVVQSAPSINSQIKDSGIIEGGRDGFSAKELDFLISVLRSGSLPATLNSEPLQEENIGPTLGDDTIAKGLFAIYVSMLVVPIFMMVYYRFAGVVAVVCLLLNMLLLVGTMAIFESSFTLPGLAGLALTIGMAVDANVLIFERMREEAEKGAAMGQQIRNGFNRAWTTILDANVTTMLSGFVLYAVGTDEVKGFALTLIIGLVWNLFTAVYVSRVIFDFWYSRGGRKLTMMKIKFPPNIDFISVRKKCMIGSVIIISLGLVAFFARGVGMYNIDFTGGTLVTIRLNPDADDIKSLTPSQRASFVRDKARALPDVTVESLSVGGDRNGTRYNIRTTEMNRDLVRDTVVGQFGDALQKVQMTVGKVTPIAAAPADAKAKDTSTPDARFAGGRSYDLKFNSPQSAGAIGGILRRVLTEGQIANPEARFELVNPKLLPNATSAPDSDTLTLKTDLDPDVADARLKALTAALPKETSLLFERSETVGSTVAGETQTLAVLATIASWVIIASYLWFRFKSITYGLAAIIAVVHDVLFTLGAVAVTYWLSMVPVVSDVLQLEPFKIDLPMIAAFLTLIGFSVNDTIVIFDRIRELKGKTPYLTAQMINDAVNQTMSRTILTSLTAWLVVVILYFVGGEGLHGFAFSLVVGFLSGTYSTIYIASPVLIDWAGAKPAKTKAELAKV